MYMIIKNKITLLLISVFLISCTKDLPYLNTPDPVLKDDAEYIVVIGDIQEYTHDKDKLKYYKATINWIYSQIVNGKKIKCVLQTGDLTNNNMDWQYNAFYHSSSDLFELVPLVACTGNHDYSYDTKDYKIFDRKSTLFSDYTKFSATTSIVIDMYEPNIMDNAIYKNIIGGKRYDVISLEFGAREEVVNWANQHIKRHPDRKYILLTHEFLTGGGERISSGSYSESQFKGTNSTYSTPEAVWQHLVYPNDNIFCVICGHNGFCAYLNSPNEVERNVLQGLFNLQYQENGGDGWIQLWEFPMGQDYVNIGVYNTISRTWHDNENYFISTQYIY